MTPAQILSHLSPQDRADALAKFLQIENFDYSGMTREDHDIVQLGHYTDLHDELVAKARASMELDRERAAGMQAIHQATPNHLLFNGTARAA